MCESVTNCASVISLWNMKWRISLWWLLKEISFSPCFKFFVIAKVEFSDSFTWKKKQLDSKSWLKVHQIYISCYESMLFTFLYSSLLCGCDLSYKNILEFTFCILLSLVNKDRSTILFVTSTLHFKLWAFKELKLFSLLLKYYNSMCDDKNKIYSEDNVWKCNKLCLCYQLMKYEVKNFTLVALEGNFVFSMF